MSELEENKPGMVDVFQTNLQKAGLPVEVKHLQHFTDKHGLVWEDGGTDTDDHLSHGGHETDLVDIANALLPQDGAFLDVGAHVGLYTLRLAAKAAHVYAVEANPKTYTVLKRNIRANNLKVPAYISTINAAAWDDHTWLGLEDANEKDTGGSTKCVEGGEQVKAMPLDFVLGDRRVDLVKIDVEGAEARVLRGLEKCIEMHRPTLFIEMHDVEYSDPSIRTDVLSFLESHHYSWDDNLKHGGQYYIVATDSDVTAIATEDSWVPEVVKAGDTGPVDERTAAALVAKMVEEDQ